MGSCCGLAVCLPTFGQLKRNSIHIDTGPLLYTCVHMGYSLLVHLLYQQVMGARHQLSAYCRGIEWATLESILRSRVVRHRDEKNMNNRHGERSIQASHDDSHGRRGGLRGGRARGCIVHLPSRSSKIFKFAQSLRIRQK